MCGIAGFHLKDPTWVRKHDNMELFADLLLKGIEQRGIQATGFMAVTPDSKKIEVHKEALSASDFIKIRKRIPKGAQTVLLHTRWATKGDNDKNYNIHPVIYGSCFAVHNGIISNDDALFTKHELVRHAEVDSEIIPALLDKFGWDNAAEALHELWGSFAIAAIDPIKHKNKLLLAKGGGSPLVYYENEKFIVWASLGWAIRDAWKEVLGTPPDYQKFSHFTEGDMLHIEGDKVTLDRFEVGKRPFVQSKYGEHGRRHQSPILGSFTRQHGESSTTSRSMRGEGSTRGIVVQRKAEVSQLREAGLGIARLWDKKDDYDREKMFADSANVITWKGCPGCGVLVFGQDFVYLSKEGIVCLDCHDVATKEVEFVIDDATKGKLERWCAKEQVAHELALEAVELRTGLSRNVVDYLIFRVAESYLDATPVMAEIANNLDDFYQKDLDEAFTSLLDEHDDEGRSLDDAFAKAVAEEKSPAVRCEKCRKFKSTYTPCRPCAEKVAVDAAITDAKPAKLTECWCGDKATVLVGRIAGFCAPHYADCNEEGCTHGAWVKGVRIEGPGFANHLLTNGKRVCHFHARGEKGAWGDRQIKKAGVIVQTIVPVREAREPGGL